MIGMIASLLKPGLPEHRTPRSIRGAVQQCRDTPGAKPLGRGQALVGLPVRQA